MIQSIFFVIGVRNVSTCDDDDDDGAYFLRFSLSRVRRRKKLKSEKRQKRDASPTKFSLEKVVGKHSPFLTRRIISHCTK